MDCLIYLIPAAIIFLILGYNIFLTYLTINILNILKQEDPVMWEKLAKDVKYTEGRVVREKMFQDYLKDDNFSDNHLLKKRVDLLKKINIYYKMGIKVKTSIGILILLFIFFLILLLIAFL